MSLHIPVTSMVPSNVIPDAQILSDALQLAFYQLGDGLFRFPGNTTVNHVSVPTYTLNGQVIPSDHLKIQVRQSAGLIAGVVISSGNASQFAPLAKLTTLQAAVGVSYVVLTPESYEGTDGVMRLDFTEGDLSIQATPPVLDSNGRVAALALAKLTIPPHTTAITSAMITDMRQFLSQPGIGISISGLPTAGQVPVATGVADEAIWSSNAGGGNTSFELVTESISGGEVVNTIPTGYGPQCCVFDGTNVWSVCTDGTITQILASTGAVVNSYFFAPGNTQTGSVCTDGSNLWIPVGGYGEVIKVSQATGATVGSFATGGGNAIGSCFDGANVWVTDYSTGTVTKFLASTGALIANYPTNTNGNYTCVFDGVNIWVPSSLSNNVTAINASTGAIALVVPCGNNPVGACYDGVVLPNVPSGAPTGNIWVNNALSNTLTKIQASTGTVLGTFTYPGPNYLFDIWFDGTYIWGACPGSNTVMQFSTGGALLGTFTAGSGPLAGGYGDGFIWVANSAGNTISQLVTTGGFVGTAPTSSSFPGTQGQVAYDASWLYICVAPNTWVRAALSSF